MVATGGEERRLRAKAGDEVEPHLVTVERDRPVEVRDLEVNVANPGLRRNRWQRHSSWNSFNLDSLMRRCRETGNEMATDLMSLRIVGLRQRFAGGGWRVTITRYIVMVEVVLVRAGRFLIALRSEQEEH